MVLYTPLRCRECRLRFWRFSPLKPLLLLIALAALIGLTAWLGSFSQAPRTDSVAASSAPHVQAEQGDAQAQLRLGLRYAEGDGLVQNDKEAAKWLGLAAKQGLAEAQYHYGIALLEGRGVVQDYKAAFSWIEKTAQRGYAPAQYSLGELYRYGTGTAIDKARAYLWFNLAAAQGLEAAAKARDSLVWQLKPEQIVAMQEEARRMNHKANQTPPATTLAAEPAPAAPATP